MSYMLYLKQYVHQFCRRRSTKVRLGSTKTREPYAHLHYAETNEQLKSKTAFFITISVIFIKPIK